MSRAPAPEQPLLEGSPSGAIRAVSVLPDVTGVDRRFTYRVPQGMAVATGMIVRVPLGARNVRGWVVNDEVSAPAGVALKAVERVVSLGLSRELVGLAHFGQWRYAGRLRPFLLAGSPERIVPLAELEVAGQQPLSPVSSDESDPVARGTHELFVAGGGVLQLPPTAARLTVVVQLIGEIGGRDLLVVVPERRDGETLARRLLRLGYPAALLPEAWVRAHRGGCVVIGTRTAVFGPVRDLGAVVVLDAHAESYVEQRSPMWNGVVLAQERARRVGVPCIAVSPCPPLVLTEGATLISLPRSEERAAWPAVEIIDRRGDDPRSGLYSPPLAEMIRGALSRDNRPVVCVLHRTGRLRLLACVSCGELARCSDCGGAMRQLERPSEGEASLLTCSECGATRPVICTNCHATALKTLRVGAKRASEELSALVGVPTALVVGGDENTPETSARVLVGTEAVLHRVPSASLVVFLDFDQHLLAPRYGALEEALALLARGGRLVGARHGHPSNGFVRRLIIQTRMPDHAVLASAVEGDPGYLRTEETERRRALRLPPYAAIALVAGEDAGQMIDLVSADSSIETAVLDQLPATAKRPASTRFIVRADSHAILCDALAATGLIGRTIHIEVDPRAI